MILIAGLGNPGEKYAQTRHNLGFTVLNRLGVGYLYSKKFNTEVAKLNNEVILAKPQTFMNSSGMAVAKIARFYKVTPENIWIIHDDVDLPLGKLKIRLGGAAAGHHGVESVIKELGTDKFVRFRLGIGHPRQKGRQAQGGSSAVEKYVLRSFDVNEKSEMKQIIKKTVKAIQKALDQNLERAMNEFN